MNRIANRAIAVWVLIALLLGGVTFFVVEYFLRGDSWVMTQGSPHIYDGSNLGTGVVTDRTGALLLNTADNRTYSTTKELRMATLHWLGDRYGYIHAPAVSAYAQQMAGYNPLTGLYAYSGKGTARLTLSAKLQTAALKEMADHKGTIAMYNYKTGEILCAVSTPTYDPDNIPDISGDTDGAYEGVYVNRFVQSVYVPGSIFKLVTTAAALEELADIREQSFTCTGTYSYGREEVTCELVHGELDFDSALAQSCNCAFAAIVDQLGPEKLQKYVDKYGVTASISFDGITVASGNFTVNGASAIQVAWSGIGQHKDQVNPCAFLTFVGAIANGGKGVQPHIVSEVTCGDSVTYRASATAGDRILPEAVAEELRAMMRNNVIEKYGVENFPDVPVCGKSGTAQMGGDKQSNAMFAGFVADDDYPIAFFVAVEEAGYGRQICVPILNELLPVCMEVMDAE